MSTAAQREEKSPFKTRDQIREECRSLALPALKMAAERTAPGNSVTALLERPADEPLPTHLSTGEESVRICGTSHAVALCSLEHSGIDFTFFTLPCGRVRLCAEEDWGILEGRPSLARHLRELLEAYFEEVARGRPGCVAWNVAEDVEERKMVLNLMLFYYP